MPKIRFENGKVVNFEGNPTQQDIDEIAQKLGFSQEKIIKSPFLPNFSNVEQQISDRPSSVDRFKEELRTPFSGNILQRGIKAGVTGLKGVSIPFQKVESGLASAGLEAQKGGNIKNVLTGFGRGLTNRNAEFGDIIRTTGFGGSANEFLASTTGFLGSLGMANVMTKGKLIEGTNKITNTLQEAKKANDLRNRTKFIQQAKKLEDGVDDVFSNLRKEADDIYNKIGDNKISPVDEKITQEIVNRLPSTTVNKIKNTAKVTGRGPIIGEFVESGNKFVLKPNINTLKRIKTQIGNDIPSKVWSGIEDATESQAKMIDDYFTIRDLISKNAGDNIDDLTQLNSKFKDMYKFNRIIKSITRKPKTGVQSSNIRNIRNPAMEGEYKELVNFTNQFYPQAEGIIKTIDKINRGIAFKKGVGTALKFGVGLEAGRRLIFNPFLDSMSGNK